MPPPTPLPAAPPPDAAALLKPNQPRRFVKAENAREAFLRKARIDKALIVPIKMSVTYWLSSTGSMTSLSCDKRRRIHPKDLQDTAV